MSLELPTRPEVFSMDARPFAYAMIKPQGLEVREAIINKLQGMGEIVHSSKTTVDPAAISEHYIAKQNERYFKSIVDYMSYKPVERIILQGYGEPAEFIKQLRDLAGVMKPLKADDGTIRRMAIDNVMPHIMITPQADRELQQFAYDNLIHTSDSFEAAMDEIRIWFADQPQVIDAAYKSYLSQYRES